MNTTIGQGLTIDRIILIMLFFFSMDFLDLSGVLITLSILILVFFKFTILKLDKNTALLLFFSFFYFCSIAYFEEVSIANFIKYAIAPWGCYVLGFNLDLKRGKITITSLVTLLAIGFFIHGMLNLFSSIKMYGVNFNATYRIAYDYWQNREISVTTAALYYSPLALLAVGAIFTYKKIVLKIAFFTIIVISLYASLIYQNRTLIVALGLILLLNILNSFKGDKFITRNNVRKLPLLMPWFFLLFVIATVFFPVVSSFLERTSLLQRFIGGNLDRLLIWESFIFGEAWDYLLGGSQAILYNNKPYVHNLWLDVFRRAGILPFLLLTVFSFRGISSFKIFANYKTKDSENSKSLLLSFFAGIVLLFMVEPIIEANSYIFYFPLIILGVICRLNMENIKLVAKKYGKP